MTLGPTNEGVLYLIDHRYNRDRPGGREHRYMSLINGSRGPWMENEYTAQEQGEQHARLMMNQHQHLASIEHACTRIITDGILDRMAGGIKTDQEQWDELGVDGGPIEPEAMKRILEEHWAGLKTDREGTSHDL